MMKNLFALSLATSLLAALAPLTQAAPPTATFADEPEAVAFARDRRAAR